MTDLNYYETLIAVADDCPVSAAVAPEKRGGKATIATRQYEMLAGNPYRYTQEDVLFQTWLGRQDGSDLLTKSEIAELWQAFFSKPQACLRSSPLPKRYGWGLRFDRQGRVALCPMESAEYRDVLSGKTGEVVILKALRSRRI